MDVSTKLLSRRLHSLREENWQYTVEESGWHKIHFLQKTYKIDHSEHTNHIGLSIETSKHRNL